MGSPKGFIAYVSGRAFTFYHVGEDRKQVKCKWCGRKSDLRGMASRRGIEGTSHDPGCPGKPFSKPGATPQGSRSLRPGNENQALRRVHNHGSAL